MKRLSLILAAAFVFSALAGCGSMVRVNHDAEQGINTSESAARHSLDKLREVPAPAQLVTVSDLPYVDTDAVSYTEAYPSKFNEPAMLNSAPQSVWSLMQNLSSLTGYRVTADDDLENDASGTRGAESGRKTIGAIAYQGTFKGLFDKIAGELNATWRFDAQSQSVYFYRYETRVFHIATVPGSADASNDIGKDGNEVSGTQGQTVKVASGGAKVSYDAKLSVWSTLKDNITPMLSSSGTLALSEPTASITVRDRWDRVKEVSDYVESLNRSLTMQVRVNVTVYRITRARGDTRGFNWSALYNALGQRAAQFGLSIATPRPTDSGLSSLVLTSPSKNSRGSTVPFSGSKAFIDALNTVGDASVVTQNGIVTVNNVPAVFADFKSKGYLAQTQGLIAGGLGSSPVGAGATLTPGSVETGFSMSVLPSVQPDGRRVLIQATLSMSSLDSLLSVDSGGQSIQVPAVSGKKLMPRAWLRSGQTLVLAGFEDGESKRDIATPFGERSWFLGGNRGASTSNAAFVIVITPIVTSNENSI
jgi:type IVB pilus formation R64 PilN family outer membrane protein